MSATTKKVLKIVIPVIIAVIIGVIPAPEGLTQPAMIYAGIFVCVVAWLVLRAVPDWAAFLACLTAYVVFGLAKFGDVFSSFADGTIWVLFGAFGISTVIAKTGLVKRLAFWVLRLFPETYRGQMTAFYATGLVVSPFIPALIGKGVILSPIAAAASKALGYERSSKQATGMFLAVWVTAGILGFAFMTGAAPVLITIGMLPADQQANWTWTSWFAACAIWFVVVAVLSYIAILFISGANKPQSKPVAAAGEKGFAAKQLEDLGPMSNAEKATIALLAVAVIGWIFGSKVGLSAAIVSVGIFAIMAVIGLADTKDVTERMPWDTLILIGGILSLASLLTKLGISTWLATAMEPVAAPIVANPYIYVFAVCILTYLVRLVVVSSTATQVIFLAALGGVAAAAGINPFVTLFVCGASANVWHLRFTNNVFIPILRATGHDMCEHEDTLSFDIAFMVINLIACLASVPLWQSLGLA